MPIDTPLSDLSRARSNEPNERFPTSVALAVTWIDAAGNRHTRRLDIGADQFFGRGQFGAPITGDWMIQAIERMRREGPPARPEPRPRVKTGKSTPNGQKDRPAHRRLP